MHSNIDSLRLHQPFSLFEVQWNLYSVDTLGLAIFVLNREVSTIKRFQNALALCIFVPLKCVLNREVFCIVSLI